MRRILTITFALVLTTALPSFAQLTIENSKNVDVPKQKAEVIYRLTCRIVADELRGMQETSSQFPLTLVMGADDERYTADDKKHIYKIYLKHWDEQLFASSTMM